MLRRELLSDESAAASRAPVHSLNPAYVVLELPGTMEDQPDGAVGTVEPEGHSHEHKIGIPIQEDEHERRWLVPKQVLPMLYIDETVELGRSERIIQGYMRDAEGRKYRLRQTTDLATRAVSYMVNRKLPKGESRVSRGEPKVYVNEQIFRDFWPLASQQFLAKLRQHMQWRDARIGGNLHIELDDVGDPDWVIAEVEFDSEEAARDKALVIPHWFGEEVTENKAWGNNSIAKYGTPRPAEQVSPKPDEPKKKHKKK